MNPDWRAADIAMYHKGNTFAHINLDWPVKPLRYVDEGEVRNIRSQVRITRYLTNNVGNVTKSTQ
jgi:hypothetical protein